MWLAAPLLLIVPLFSLFACCCPSNAVRVTPAAAANDPIPAIGTENPPIPLEAVPARETETEMRNVNFHIDRTAVLHIHDLRGQMYDKEKGKPLDFDDKRSFTMKIFQAHVGVTGQSLTDLMDRYVFNYKGAPLKNLKVTIQNGKLVQQGELHKIIDIPFVMTADVSATSDGWIRIHPVAIEICSLNGMALMKAFGMSLEKVMTNLPPGVRVEKNDTLIEPLKILPPPSIEGRLVGVSIAGDELLQDFDDGHHATPLALPVPAANFMYFRNGTLRMGKLFMVSADMEVIDLNPRDPFDFDIDEYNKQLVAGRDQNRDNYGLTIYMRDYHELGKRPLLAGYSIEK